MRMQTLANFNQGGCMYVMPIILCMGFGSMLFAGWLCWGKGMKDDYIQAQLVNMDGSNRGAQHDGSAQHRGPQQTGIGGGGGSIGDGGISSDGGEARRGRVSMPGATAESNTAVSGSGIVQRVGGNVRAE